MDFIHHIQKRAADLLPEVIAHRRHLHAHPELSFEEFKTAAYVEEQLKALGITNVQTMAVTGRVATIEGRNPKKKVVALRADMDALPIQEQNEVAYKSCNAGVMHACGHDVHTASLLGAASILQGMRNQFEGTVKLVFQPGEEKLPGGASLMIKEGVLQSPAVHRMLGQHVMPLLPVGKVGFRPGLYMASTDEIFVTVKGKGGHGAMPHLNIDPVMVTAQMLTALQQVVSRGANPTIPSVLSFGKVIANGATNVIPNEVYLEGTFRTLDEKWREEAHRQILRVAHGVAESYGATVEFNIMKGYPFLKNDEQLTAQAKAAAVAYLGAEQVVDLDIWMAAEDFSFYSQEVPACFYRLGTRNESRGIISSVHTPTFDIDETALETGMGLMAWQAVSALREQ